MSASPLVFYAYPSQPKDVGACIERAIADVNSSGVARIKGWRSLNIAGKIVINEILDAISQSSVFACDLTYLNPNVLFELGYAIGRGKRLWISLNSSIESSARDYQRLSPIMSPIGYAEYHNGPGLAAALFRDRPWEDTVRPSLDLALHAGKPLFGKPHVLHLQSQVETDGSIALSETLRGFREFGVAVDDPLEVPIATLDWYVQTASEAVGVVAYLLNNQYKNHIWHNAKCSLVCGIALGLSKPLLMLAQEPFDSPFDYQQLLATHDTAPSCRTLARTWLEGLRRGVSSHSQTIAERQRSQQRAFELRRLSLGEFIAENEEGRLSSYFVPTSSFIEACRAQQMVFIGRKGTGKTANLYAVASKIRESRDNHVCVIKPVGYEVEGVLRMLRQTLDRSEKGYLVESLWKFLVYTELASSVYTELQDRPPYRSISSQEQAFCQFVEENEDLVLAPFSIRLQTAVESLASLESFRPGDEQRAKVSEALHSRFLSRLREQLGVALQTKDRVVILVDNLDKTWGSRDDVSYLAEMLFGLLGIVRRVGDEFQASDSRRKRVNLSLVVFLRSDIFSYIQSFAREKDKLLFTRISWDDPELLLRVLEDRLQYSLDGTITPEEIWSELFVPSVRGRATRDFIANSVVQRPRDIIYFVRVAVAEAVNRGHGQVEESDLLTAAAKYAQFAFDSLIAEDDPRLGRLEAVLYEFAGSSRILTRSEVAETIAKAGVSAEDVERYLNLLCDLGFLGIETARDKYEFPQSEEERRVRQVVARKVAERSFLGQERYAINSVFSPVLAIR